MIPAEIQRELQKLRQDVAMRPITVPRGGGAVSQALVLVILNGNAVGNGAKGILYAGTVTLAAAPDLNLDTDVVAGLGRANLYTDGVLTGRVWVRHDRADDPCPLQAGARRTGASTTSISYGTGSITAYRWAP